MAPTKRTSLTWKEKVVILDKLQLLKHGTSQRSAAEQLDIIGFGCCAQYSWHFEDELGRTGFIIQLLISATLVRSGAGCYNRILLYYIYGVADFYGLFFLAGERVIDATTEPH